MLVWVTNLWEGSYFSEAHGVRNMLTQQRSQMYATLFWVAFVKYNICCLDLWWLIQTTVCVFLTKAGNIWLLSYTGTSCTSPWTPPPWCESHNIRSSGQYASMVQKVNSSWNLPLETVCIPVSLSSCSFLLFHAALCLESSKVIRRNSQAGAESASVKRKRRKCGRLML